MKKTYRFFFCENCTQEIAGIKFERLNPGGGSNFGGFIVDPDTDAGKEQLGKLEPISKDVKSGVHEISAEEFAKMDKSKRNEPIIRHVESTKGAIQMAKDKGAKAPVTVKTEDGPPQIVDPDSVGPVRPPKGQRPPVKPPVE